MRERLFDTKFSGTGLVLDDKTIPYSTIRAISHFNRRHIVNFVPEYEAFCILIEEASGRSTLLYDRIRLREYAGADGLMTGFKIPSAIEKEITNLRYEYLATLELLKQRSGVTPVEKGFLFETGMEFLALVKSSHVASAPAEPTLGYRLGKWAAHFFRGTRREK